MIITPAKQRKFTTTALVLTVMGMAGLACASTLPEPATVFYGRIWAAGSAEPFLVSTGQLQWTIRRSDGTDLTLRTRVQLLNGGEFSYRLDVPHDAQALELSSSTTAIALGTMPERHTHYGISVDGQPAQILGPSGSSFEGAQTYRAATYRLDLVVGLGATDIDGNGIPDWWESRYGLNDPFADPDGDGLNNLAEYQRRSDPRHDDRAPTLATREFRAHADGTTVVRLHAIDADSAPANLRYHLTRVPQEGTLYLRNAAATPGAADQVLAAGASFTQAELLRGKLIFVHASATAPSDRTSFEVTLRDENTSHATVTGSVSVVFYRPTVTEAALQQFNAATASGNSWPDLAGIPTPEAALVMSHLLSAQARYVVADALSEGASQDLAVPSSDLSRAQYDSQYVPSYGRDRHHVLLGGLGSDRISAGMEDDVVIGSRGNDFLRGNGGSDRFILTGPDDGSDTIEDFDLAENDRIDISRALIGTSSSLSNYVQLTRSGTNSLVGIDPYGNGAANPSIVLTVANTQLGSLYDLVESGHLITGNKALPARITLIASQPNAAENGPTTGAFTLSRSGSLESALMVTVHVTGSAANGVDYVFVNPQATFLPGQDRLRIEIRPYVDTVTELSEVVQISVLAGPGYALGAATTAQVSIEDLAPQVSIEALEPVGAKSTLTPGIFLVTRESVLERSLLVRLKVGGSASSSDYTGVPTFVNFAPWQTTALITVTPRSTAVLANGIEYVELSILADAAYKIVEPSVARVFLVEEQTTFGLWRDRYFAEVGEDLFTFANRDPGQTGVRAIQRYAFGLDAYAPQESPGRPSFQVRDNHLTVAFRRPVAVMDVQYVVEISEDLVTWHSGNGYVEPFTAPDLANQPETVCYRINRSISEVQTMFMRVRVAYTP